MALINIVLDIGKKGDAVFTEVLGGLKAVGKESQAAGGFLKSVFQVGQGFGQEVYGVLQKIAGALPAVASRALEFAGRFTDLQGRTRASAEALQAWDFAGAQMGTSAEEISGGLEKLQRGLVEGSDKTTQAVSRLGLSTSQLRSLKPEEQLQAVLERLDKIPDPAMRTATGIDLLGKGSAGLAQLGSQFQELMERARDLGVVMSDKTRQALDDLGDAGGELMAVLEGLGRNMLSGVLASQPLKAIVVEISTAVGAASRWFQENQDAITSWVDAGILRAVDAGAALLHWVIEAYDSLGGLTGIVERAEDVWNGLVAVWEAVGVPVAHLLVGALQVLADGVKTLTLGYIDLNTALQNGSVLWDSLKLLWLGLKAAVVDLAVGVLTAKKALMFDGDPLKAEVQQDIDALKGLKAAWSDAANDIVNGTQRTVVASKGAHDAVDQVAGRIRDAAKAHGEGAAAARGWSGAVDTATAASRKHAEEIGKLKDRLLGTDLQKDLANTSEALKGVDLSKLSQSQVDSIARDVAPKVQEALAKGFQVPESLMSLAARHNANLAKEAQRQFDATVFAANDNAIASLFEQANEKAMEEAVEAARQWLEVRNAAVSAFAEIGHELGSIVGGAFGKLISTAASAWTTIADLFTVRMGKAGLAVAQGLQAALGAVMSGFQAGLSGGKGKGALLGGVTGALGGAAAGAAIGSQLGIIGGGPAGAVVGAAAGGLFGVIGGLFGGAKKEREELKALQTDLLQTYGGMDALRKLANQLGVDISRAFGSNLKQAKAAIEQFNAAVKAHEQRVEGLKQALSGVELQTKGWLMQLERAGQATASDQAQFDRLGARTALTFAQLVKETGDLLGAFQLLGPQLDQLIAAQEKYGLTASESFSKLLGLREVALANEDLMLQIQGVTAQLEGFGKAGLLTRDMFQSLGADVGAQWREMEARGIDATQGMILMQPELQKLWEYQERYGTITDETTQKLLKQAEDQGLVGENMKSVNDKILDVLVAIANVFKADLPEGLRTTQSAWDDLNHTAGQTPRPPGVPDYHQPDYGSGHASGFFSPSMGWGPLPGGGTPMVVHPLERVEITPATQNVLPFRPRSANGNAALPVRAGAAAGGGRNAGNTSVHVTAGLTLGPGSIVVNGATDPVRTAREVAVALESGAVPQLATAIVTKVGPRLRTA